MASDHFGRMFNNLPPFAPPNPKVAEALIELGKPGGLMDADDDLDAGASRADCKTRCSTSKIRITTLILPASRSWVSSSTTT